MKRCSRCKQILCATIIYFFMLANGQLSPTCKVCRNKDNREWYESINRSNQS